MVAEAVLVGVAVLGLAAFAGAQPPEDAVLTDVPRIGFDRHLCPFPGSLYACLEYLGDPCEHPYLMGVTGAAFRRIWNRDDGGNVDLMYLAPEPHRRAFEALGYEYRTVPLDRETMLQAIRDGVASGRPVISFGFVGPPEAGIITGYGRGGDVVRGWSYFQQDADKGYYSLPDWFDAMATGPPFGLITIGDPTPTRPSPEEVLIESLEWAIDLARREKRPGLPDHVCGLAAYDAWADALEVDADYSADDAAALETHAMVHCDQVVMLYERAAGASYLRAMAAEVPRAGEQLRAAADLYDAVSQHTGKVWRWGHWMQPEAKQGLADPATRREFAAQVRSARKLEAEAVGHLEAALVALGAPLDPDVPVGHLELQGSKLINYPERYRPNIEGMLAPSAMRSMMEFMGIDFGYSLSESWGTTWRTNEAFPFFMGVWGDAFDFIWYRKPGSAEDAPWAGERDAARRFRTTLAAAGLDCAVLVKGGAGPEALVAADARRRILRGIIDLGRPALILGAPAEGHAFIVTGYARHGATLLGWAVEGGDDVGIQFRPERQSALGAWPETASAVVLPGAKHDRPDEAGVYRTAIEQGVGFLRLTEAGGFLAGLATYDHLIGLLHDDTLSGAEAETVARRETILHPIIWDLATRRHYGRLFLQRAAELLPQGAEELCAAADCFGAIHDMMWEVNATAGGGYPGGPLPGLADAQVREKIVAILARAKARDIEAADHLDRALAAM